MKCPNRCEGGLEKKKILFITRKTNCHVCGGRGFVVDAIDVYQRLDEALGKKYNFKVQPKNSFRFLLEVTPRNE